MVVQMFGMPPCLFIICAVEVDGTHELAVVVENVGAIVRHGADPIEHRAV